MLLPLLTSFSHILLTRLSVPPSVVGSEHCLERLQCQGTRISLTDKGSPIVWVRILRLQCERRFSQGVCTRLTCQDTLVEVDHQFLGLLIRYFPQAHHQRLCTSEHKGTTQAEHSFPDMYFAQTRFASRENY